MLKCTDFSWMCFEETGGWLWVMAGKTSMGWTFVLLPAVNWEIAKCRHMKACKHTHTHTHCLFLQRKNSLPKLDKTWKRYKRKFSLFTFSVWYIIDTSVSLNKTTRLIRINTYFQHITFYAIIKFFYNMDFSVKWV